MSAIFFNTAGAVDLDVARRTVWEVVARALSDGGFHVLVLYNGERGGVRRETVPLCPLEADVRIGDAVASYRDGYADGYVDCLTITGRKP